VKGYVASALDQEYDGRQFVGIDLHRARSVIVRTTETGDVLEAVQIPNTPLALAQVMTRAGEHPEVVLESTYGWYWAVDTLHDLDSEPVVHLAHPLGVKAFEYRRVKNDLLTELSAGSFGRCVRGLVGLARFAPRDQRRRRAAGVVWAGGALAGVAGGDGGSVPAVPAG
jgi:hypothetical protein